MLQETLTIARRVSPRALRRNYWLGVGNGVTFAISQAFYDPNTILPLYLTLLGASHTLIGAMAAATGAGWFLPQLFVATWYERRTTKLVFYRAASVLRVSLFGVFAAAAFLLAGSNPGLAALVSVLAMLGCQLAGGMGGLAFNIIVAKTIPSHRRAGFYGTRQLFGGIGAFVAGQLIARVLSAHTQLPFPRNFAYLFAIGGVLLIASLAQFAIVREPPDPLSGPPKPLFAYWREGARRLGHDRRYLQFVITRFASGAQALALPFYVAFILSNAPVGPAFAGALLSAQVAGSALSNLVWGRMGDRRGSRQNVIAANVLSVFVPALALGGWAVPAITHAPLPAEIWGVATFALIGASNAGRGLAFTTYLLDIAPEAHRITYISFANTLAAAVGVMPLLGGVLLDGFGYELLFSVVLVAALGAALLAFSLPSGGPAHGAPRTG